MRIKEVFKIAFLYLGAMVGAGFASGNEVKLYFGSTDFLTIVLSSSLSGLGCFLFLYLGKTVKFGRKTRRVLSFVFAVCGMISSGIMLSGLNELVGSGSAAIVTALICIVVVSLFSDGAAKYCFYAVPLILIILLVVFANVPHGRIDGSFSFYSALSYAAMNVFYEFGLMYENGGALSVKEAAFVGGVVSMVTLLLLSVMRILTVNVDSSLPFVEKALSCGFEISSYVMMFLAVSSTVVGCFSLAEKYFYSIFPKSISALIVSGITLTVSTFGFSETVNKVYPIIGILGMSLIAYSIALLIKEKYRLLKKS